jgi:recombination protein RecA
MFSHPIQSAMATHPHWAGLEGLALRPVHEPPVRSLEGAASLLALAPPGKITELSGRARTSLAARLLRAVQAEGEPVAWVTLGPSVPVAASAGAASPRAGASRRSGAAPGGLMPGGLFPPDLAAAGLDLDALVVVHVSGADERMGPKAAELLLRTGAFGAVAIDADALGRAAQGGQRATAWQGRLLGILRGCEARLLVLSEGDASCPSLGPLVAVRLALACDRHGEALQVTTQVLKDKSGALGGHTPPVEAWRGPPGSTPVDAARAASSEREPAGSTARPRLVRLPRAPSAPRGWGRRDER